MSIFEVSLLFSCIGMVKRKVALSLMFLWWTRFPPLILCPQVHLFSRVKVKPAKTEHRSKRLKMAAVGFARIDRIATNEKKGIAGEKEGNHSKENPRKWSHPPGVARNPLSGGKLASPQILVALPLIDRRFALSPRPLPSPHRQQNDGREFNKRTMDGICPRWIARPLRTDLKKKMTPSYFVLSIYSLKWSGLKVSFSER